MANLFASMGAGALTEGATGAATSAIAGGQQQKKPKGAPQQGGGFDLSQLFDQGVASQAKNLMSGDMGSFLKGIEGGRTPMSVFQQPNSGFDIMQLLFR